MDETQTAALALQHVLDHVDQATRGLQARTRALLDVEGLDALAIAKKSMTIAADVCIYTNHNFLTETLSAEADAKADADAEPGAKADEE